MSFFMHISKAQTYVELQCNADVQEYSLRKKALLQQYRCLSTSFELKLQQLLMC